jgi:2-phosphosulfolactate phosphatase
MSAMRIDVVFGPAEFEALERGGLSGTACLVFDVLRATSTMAMAFANGVGRIRPVCTVEEALAERLKDPRVLLAGERGGVRIGAAATGGVEFDLGNSPREFGPEVVRGRTVAMTTTNGTRALRACAAADRVVAASFLNLGAAVADVRAAGCGRVLLVASGTGEETALEDVLAAGAAVERLMRGGVDVQPGDAAWVALGVWEAARPDFRVAMRRAANARRLLGMPDLAPDVEVCQRVDAVSVVPRMAGGCDLVLG